MEAQANASPFPSGTAARASKPRIDVYSIITERIIAELKKGAAPWRKPWTDAGIPQNLISRRAYRGINILLLGMLGYERNLFLTFKQVKELGGTVRQGEHGHMVVYWNYIERKVAHQERNDSVPIEHLAKKVPLLRYYRVFNIAQCSGLPEKYSLPVPKNEWTPLARCEAIVAGMPQKPKITHKRHEAFYDPLKDYVNVPKPTAFTSREAYYVTLFHELVHSTGHRSRLDRKGLIEMTEFGSDAYSLEELVAEIGTCYLQSFAGITSEFEQSAAYIQGWLSKLQNDPRFIFSASTDAQKATDFILNVEAAGEGNHQHDNENTQGPVIQTGPFSIHQSEGLICLFCCTHTAQFSVAFQGGQDSGRHCDCVASSLLQPMRRPKGNGINGCEMYG